MPTPGHNEQTLIEKIQSLATERIAEVENFVDFLHERAASRKTLSQKPLNFPVDNPGPWPERFSLRREDMYGDEGR